MLTNGSVNSDFKNRLVYHWLFAGVLIAFVAIKFYDLFLPYFWDELAVYSQGAVYQFYHGIGLMPFSLPPDLSRGHPLLFTFFNAAAMKVFGTGVWVGHTLELFVSLLLLWVVYNYTSYYFNRLTGLIATILLAAQPMFLAQSVLVLPEVMLSLFIFLSMVSYIRRNYLLFGIYASLAMLTKESAIILPCVALAFSVIQFLLFKNRREAFSVSNLMFTFLPYLCFAVFLFAQKLQNGWYFFPYHVESMSFNLAIVKDKFMHYFNFIVWSQGRYWWMKCFLVAFVVGLLTNKLSKNTWRDSLMLLLVILGIGFLLFSALNFYMERYITIVLVIAAITTAVSIVTVFRNKWVCGIVTLLLIIVASTYYEEEHFNYDFDMGYRRQVAVLKEAINYIEELPGAEKKALGNFPAYNALAFPEGGYLRKFSSVKLLPNPNDAPFFYFVKVANGTDYNVDANKFKQRALAIFKNGHETATVYEVSRIP